MTVDSPITRLADTFSKLRMNDSPSLPVGSRTLPLATKAPRNHLHKRVPEVIPRFHFPQGKPPSSASENESALKRAAAVFARFSGCVSIENMPDVMLAVNLPIYWKRPLYDSVANTRNAQHPITFQDFAHWWNGMTSVAHDEASRFVFTMAGPTRRYIEKADFEPFLQDLIDTFPGLHFLREAKEFHSRYVQTVIVRIFYSVNRSWSGRITAAELRQSNFLQTLVRLEDTDDINTVTDYFSYEHFYVIYCKFWELDKDHDLLIDKLDMTKHGNGAIPSRVIDRVFSGAVSRGLGRGRPMDKLNYTDFVAFILAEEDKRHPTSIEYWFRCLDIDGDGVLSLYELEYFYSEVARKMEAMGIESMKFQDVACQLLDIVNPKLEDRVTLSDIKKCQMCTRFFNAFINVHKYYEQESADGERASVKTDLDEEMSDWDRFCAEEYELLMQEEQPDDMELTCDIASDEESSPGSTSLSRSNPESQLRRSPLLDTL
uniref:EF-hand domain-containing protein n=1 Tax=Plectus sambesii TaxID=2011161 RepID=A0A914WNS2_9BILA